MNLFKKIISLFKKENTKKIIKNKEEKNKKYKIKEDYKEENEAEEIIIEDLWNYIDPAKNTQAFHIISVINFDEWVDMQTIRERIKNMFFIEYKNEKSLYPYIKTLVDIGLLETNAIGGKRQWKKREILIKIKKEKELLKEKIKLKNKVSR